MDRLQSMRVFARVVDEGGFASAARVLDMSAPVVTRLVADLEEHLGTRLLQRTTRRITLTEAGQAYLARVRDILQSIEEAEELAGTSTKGLAGVLRVQAPPVLASHVLAPILAEFRRRHPMIRLDIEVDTASLGEKALEDFDLSLMLVDTTFNAEVVARKVVESDIIFVASPKYTRKHGAPQTPEDLPGHQLMRVRTPFCRVGTLRLRRTEGRRKELDLDIEPILVANHVDTLLRATLDGMGIVPVSADLVAPQLASGQLVRVLSPWTMGRMAIYAALPSRKFIPQRTKVFLDFLIEEARQQTARAALALQS